MDNVKVIIIFMSILLKVVNSDTEVYRLLRIDTSTSASPLAGENIGGNGGSIVGYTTHADCAYNNNCCLMYTWPGNDLIYNGESSSAPTSCRDIKNKKVPCFGPIVYSKPDEGMRPNVTHVIQECKDESLPCFCTAEAGKTCIKVSIFSGFRVLNETRFCGSLTNVGTNTKMKSGCYSEKLENAERREVCASEPIEIEDGFRFGNSAYKPIVPIFYSSIIIVLIIFLTIK